MHRRAHVLPDRLLAEQEFADKGLGGFRWLVAEVEFLEQPQRPRVDSHGADE